MSTRISRPGCAVLMLAHCAGMVDLVALPVWVGTLIAQYRLDPQQAGGLVTLFLAGAVASSLFFAPRLHRLRGRVAAPFGFGLAALAFFGVSLTTDYAAMAVLHALAGVSAACSLSFTHGTIARSANPHRLFALVGMALGVFGVVFLGGVPPLVAAAGGPAIFKVFAAVMLVAAVASAWAFPQADASNAPNGKPAGTIDAAVRYGVLGVSCMALVQAMTFSFLERAGADRGFGHEAVNGVLIALGVLTLFPAGLAAVLERRWSARKVVLVGPVVQAVLALLITQSTAFAPYAFGAVFFATVMIFTHTFAFGLLARLDPSGRALAATPAMLMVGAAIGPILGGTLVKLAGYETLGLAAVLIAALAVFCFSRARRESPLVGAPA